MVALKIYNWEVFERGTWRYVIFAVVIVAIVSLSLFYKSWDGLNGLIGAIILLMIVWGYLFFLSKANTETKMILKPEGLQIGDRLIQYPQIKGFVIEMEKATWKLKNIVLVYEKWVEIFTLMDTKKQQELFFSEFSKIVPFLENYEQSSLDRLMRKLKL